MGERDGVRKLPDRGEVRVFTRQRRADVRALEQMLERGMFEEDTRRVGAEQEMFLVNKDLFPAPIAMEVLSRIDDDRVGTELALFNLEANLTPREFTGSCLRDMEWLLVPTSDDLLLGTCLGPYPETRGVKALLRRE